MTATVASAPRVSPVLQMWRRWKRGPGAVIGAVILIVMIAGAVLAPWIAPYDWNETRVGPRLSPPSAEFLFGTDLYGRDLFSRVLYGARSSLSVGLATVAFALVFGSLFGVSIAYFGGRIDAIGSRMLDIMLGFPPIVLAILVVAVLGVGLWSAALAVGVASIPRFARVVRGATLSLKEQLFIDAARALGARPARIVWRHLLPNLTPVLIVLVSLDLGTAIL